MLAFQQTDEKRQTCAIWGIAVALILTGDVWASLTLMVESAGRMGEENLIKQLLPSLCKSDTGQTRSVCWI